MKYLSLTLVGALCAIAACTSGPADSEPRGPIAKADSLGSCVDSCDTISNDGTCWCDDKCESYADCCEDKAEICDTSVKLCGGIAGLTCGVGEFCAYQSCGVGGGFGACAFRPDFCSGVIAPVCGCDGVTYSNGCIAASAGVSIDHDGACTIEPECHSHNDCMEVVCPGGGFAHGLCVGGSCTQPTCGPAADSCQDNCGGPSDDASCWCDDKCEGFGDCCSDVTDHC